LYIFTRLSVQQPTKIALKTLEIAPTISAKAPMAIKTEFNERVLFSFEEILIENRYLVINSRN
jgi:hypothetical protein